ncbi:MAG: hypothetical protein IKW30_08005 [Lachnospiraceae bacterium]|nr:hypothetical protein [Lachnospiraceae bacterium]
MKEKLYTIPLNDAVNAGDECPFCFIERKLEQDLMDFVLGSGSSYMESDIRSDTDKFGFCRAHFKKMFDYGNTLGNAWILKTHYQETIKEMKKKMQGKSFVKKGFFDKKKTSTERSNTIGKWTLEREASCYICNRFKNDYPRYMDTFLYLYEKDPSFKEKILASKGFCLSHFGDLCEHAEDKLSQKQLDTFFPPLFSLMKNNMTRLYEDISWLIEKFDYENKDADWKNSKDALQRGMQKLKGGYPADSVYKKR